MLLFCVFPTSVFYTYTCPFIGGGYTLQIAFRNDYSYIYRRLFTVTPRIFEKNAYIYVQSPTPIHRRVIMREVTCFAPDKFIIRYCNVSRTGDWHTSTRVPTRRYYPLLLVPIVEQTLNTCSKVAARDFLTFVPRLLERNAVANASKLR